MSHAGLDVASCRDRDLPVTQHELRDLIELPALSARLYPDIDEAGRSAWIAAASERVEGEITSLLRWREYLVERG